MAVVERHVELGWIGGVGTGGMMAGVTRESLASHRQRRLKGYSAAGAVRSVRALPRNHVAVS